MRFGIFGAAQAGSPRPGTPMGQGFHDFIDFNVEAAWFLKMVGRTGELAKLPFPCHPHMLRHACGYKLANDGVDTRALQHFMGYANIMHTTRYTEMRPDRFNGFWKD